MFHRGTIFGFGTPIDINVIFHDASTRKRIAVTKYCNEAQSYKGPMGLGQTEAQILYLFTTGETIQGQVLVATPPDRKVDFLELKCQLIGQITTDKETTEFVTHETILSGPGTTDTLSTFDYSFADVSMPYESYTGICTHLRYLIQVTMSRAYAPTVVETQEFWVQNPEEEAEINSGIKMEVGIEDCLHIEFEYNKSKYHLNDVVLGKVFFLLVKLKVKHMELSIVRRETTGHGGTLTTESDTVATFEVMDGPPAKGESIPVRLFLGGLRLSPTYRHVHNKFSTKYYLNLVLVDEENRRYYKQQEIVLWRKHL
jgi:vacuolar protein sorting-associated protein 26